ncbi:hypothetical protein JD844_015480 [Phrynosoma platyrhinos]|uniref:Protein THEM6 n=1 Tax=Phrynosoma platyrhinos TaxID=52577 RepID=A0ABQ7SJ48_PHRPL|nr:hypothetical protein JD844_015480 [Phrynosoma platyrhinos]
MLLWLLGSVAAFFGVLDGWYLLRMPVTFLYAHWVLPAIKDLLEEQSFQSRVLLSDLDFLLHMNNARYPREADLARSVHLTRCGLFRAIRALGGHTVLSASSCRFRRSLQFLEPFEIRTQLLGWDERAFFLEQRFVSGRDGFVCAVLLVRQHLVESPELPEEVLYWMKYIEASSRRLRAESVLQENSKDQ